MFNSLALRLRRNYTKLFSQTTHTYTKEGTPVGLLLGGGGYEENFKYEFKLTHLQEEDVSKVDDLKKILKMEGSVNHE